MPQTEDKTHESESASDQSAAHKATGDKRTGVNEEQTKSDQSDERSPAPPPNPAAEADDWILHLAKRAPLVQAVGTAITVIIAVLAVMLGPSKLQQALVHAQRQLAETERSAEQSALTSDARERKALTDATLAEIQALHTTSEIQALEQVRDHLQIETKAAELKAGRVQKDSLGLEKKSATLKQEYAAKLQDVTALNLKLQEMGRKLDATRLGLSQAIADERRFLFLQAMNSDNQFFWVDTPLLVTAQSFSPQSTVDGTRGVYVGFNNSGFRGPVSFLSDQRTLVSLDTPTFVGIDDASRLAELDARAYCAAWHKVARHFVLMNVMTQSLLFPKNGGCALYVISPKTDPISEYVRLLANYTEARFSAGTSSFGTTGTMSPSELTEIVNSVVSQVRSYRLVAGDNEVQIIYGMLPNGDEMGADMKFSGYGFFGIHVNHVHWTDLAIQFPHLSPIVAESIALQCDAERMPWDELRADAILAAANVSTASNPCRMMSSRLSFVRLTEASRDQFARNAIAMSLLHDSIAIALAQLMSEVSGRAFDSQGTSH